MGDEAADRRRFETLYETNAADVLAYALRRAPRRADAADIVAETMLVAWRRLDDVPAGPDARLWLFGVARRVVANHGRGARRRFRLGERLRDALGRENAPAADSFAPDDDVIVALNRLSPDDREILRLATWEGLSGPEIATVLDLSPEAVRSRIHRARGRLRDALTLTRTSVRRS